MSKKTIDTPNRFVCCENTRSRAFHSYLRPLFFVCGGILSSAVASHGALAMNLYSGASAGNDLEINLDTTIEYSTFYRVNDPSAVILNASNFNDGDENFKHGFVSNEFEAIPVLDIKDGDYGAHVSGEFYLNTVYLQHNQNSSPATINQYDPADNTSFSSATRNVNGENAMLLDAFAYGKEYFGANEGQSLEVKVGRQTLLWGQSLFFAGNGVAAGQAPIDLIAAEGLPNPQAQQIFLPVGQAVVTYQPNQIVTLQAYYQFEWKPDNFEGTGAYFSNADFLARSQSIVAVPGAVYLYRVKDNTPPINNGQFGASVQATLDNYDLGLYALRYDSKAPDIYDGAPQAGGGPGINAGSFWLVYPRDIQLYGASLGTTVGPVDIGAELSGRRNMPLVELNVIPAVYPGGANNGETYATGSTWAGQTSAIYVSPGLPLDPGGVTLVGEFAMNHVLSYENKAELTPGRDNTAGAFEAVITPSYFDVLPNTELQFPVGIEDNLFGRSQIDPTMNHGTGSVSFGVTATYRTTWVAGLTYKDYFGKPDPVLNDLADRGYVSLNLNHTF